MRPNSDTIVTKRAARRRAAIILESALPRLLRHAHDRVEILGPSRLEEVEPGVRHVRREHVELPEDVQRELERPGPSYMVDTLLDLRRELGDAQPLCLILGMDALLEVHSLPELERAQQTRAELLGINNRDLTTFKTSLENTFNLLPYCASERLIISESGISDEADALRLKCAGARGALVGESLVRSDDIARKTRALALLQNGLEE